MVGKTVSHYKVLQELGEGGMGRVYLAQDTRLKRKVALKFLPPDCAGDADGLASIKREAQAAAALNHPNIITVYEVDQHESRPFIAMSYFEGQSLAAHMASRTPSVDEALGIAAQMCDALQAAHQAGIVHRDITPDNVLIDKAGRIKILDFGLATSVRGETHKRDKSIAGTMGYMAPEQLNGRGADHRSDIFALGAVLYEMITGRSPFASEHAAAVQYSVENLDPRPLSGFTNKAPPALEYVVARALDKNPNDRYQSAAEMCKDVRAVRGGMTTVRPQGPRLRHVAVLVAALFIAVLAWVLKPREVGLDPRNPIISDNTVAVMAFENIGNRSDPERLGEIIAELLITDLSEAGTLNVLSSERLHDILESQGGEDVAALDRSAASRLAADAGARWMLVGSVFQVEPHLVLASQLVDTRSGQVVSGRRVVGSPGESIISMVDRLSAETRNDLPPPGLSPP